jgi:hypothetical protein
VLPQKPCEGVADLRNLNHTGECTTRRRHATRRDLLVVAS